MFYLKLKGRTNFFQKTYTMIFSDTEKCSQYCSPSIPIHQNSQNFILHSHPPIRYIQYLKIFLHYVMLKINKIPL